MNSAKDANITENTLRMLETTQQHWLCFAQSTHTKVAGESEPASTTAQEGRAEKKAVNSNH